VRWFNERRGQKVRENPRLRLGEVRFVPGNSDTAKAEMSQDTWDLLQGDENMGRAYATARSRAMRQSHPSSMNLVGSAVGSAPSGLDELETQLSGLLGALHAIDDPSEFGSTDLLRRRQAVRAQLLQIEERVRTCRTRLEVVDELVNARVLA
jgi:hypothetical protein